MGHAKDTGGVWGHSSELGAKSYYIFAVGDQSLITEKAFMQWCVNSNIDYKSLIGSYNGVTEHSFIVNSDHIVSVAIGGWLDKQDSILHLGHCDSRDRRPATLFYLADGKGFNDPIRKPESLGVFQSVSRAEAMAQMGWTFDPTLNEYFICKDPDEVPICPTGLDAAQEAFYEISPDLGSQEGYGKTYTRDIICAYLKNRRIM